MSTNVWLSTAPGDPTLSGGWGKSEEPEGNRQDVYRRARQGEPVQPSEMPRVIWKEPSDYRAHHFPGVWPDLANHTGFFLISERFRNILGAFDLGNSAIEPLRLLNRNDEPIAGNWFCWAVGNQKAGIVGSQSEGLFDVGEGKYIHAGLQSHQVKCSRDILRGPQAWFDTQLQDALFLGPELGVALADAGLATKSSGLGELVVCDLLQN